MPSHAKHPHTMMLPPLCLTVFYRLQSFNCSPGFFHTLIRFCCPNSSNYITPNDSFPEVSCYSGVLFCKVQSFLLVFCTNQRSHSYTIDKPFDEFCIKKWINTKILSTRFLRIFSTFTKNLSSCQSRSSSTRFTYDRSSLSNFVPYLSDSRMRKPILFSGCSKRIMAFHIVYIFYIWFADLQNCFAIILNHENRSYRLESWSDMMKCKPQHCCF